MQPKNYRRLSMKKTAVENCYQCSHYQTCYLRVTLENLLDKWHHDLTVGGKTALRNSIPLPFLERLASICNMKDGKE